MMRTILVGCLVGMAGLALLFLRTRRLTRLAFFAWALIASLLPAFGPFLVILLRPGRSSYRPPSRVRLIWGRTRL